MKKIISNFITYKILFLLLFANLTFKYFSMLRKKTLCKGHTGMQYA